MLEILRDLQKTVQKLLLPKPQKWRLPSRPDPTSLGYRTPSQSPDAVRATNPQRQRSWRIEAAGDPDAPIIWDCTHNWMING